MFLAAERASEIHLADYLPANLREIRPLPERYATVISAYCADSATADRDTREALMRNITSLVQPGGLFLTAALRRCRAYMVGGKRFPSANVDESVLRAVLERAFGRATVETRMLAEQESHGYRGILLAGAQAASSSRRMPATGIATQSGRLLSS